MIWIRSGKETLKNDLVWSCKEAWENVLIYLIKEALRKTL